MLYDTSTRRLQPADINASKITRLILFLDKGRTPTNNVHQIGKQYL